MKYTDTIYGEVELSGVIEELIKTEVFQRLRKIHQGGAIFLVNPKANHTRFDHSVGVMLLIKKLGGSIEEQIAGLIHDISHTAFSHLIDYVLDIEEEDYHEKRYEEVLMDEELAGVLKKYGFTTQTFLNLEQYQLLEYPLPGLSADRIDYTLRDLFQIGEISKQASNAFLEELKIFNNRIVLHSVEQGKWFHSKYHFLISEYFGGRENVEINIIMKKIIKECLTTGLIEQSDFHKDDFYLIEKINSHFDLKARITKLRKQGINSKAFSMKKRTVDPEILMNDQAIKLSEIG